MAKYLIVVWKWNLKWVNQFENIIRTTNREFIDFIGKGNKRFEVKVEPKENQEELVFVGFTKSNSYNPSEQYSDQDIIAECQNIFKQDEINSKQILLLLHQGGEDRFDDGRKQAILNNFNDKKIKARLFFGGTGKFYEELVVENESYFKEDAILNPLNENNFQIKREKFLSVWDWYWNKLDLEYQKKNLINLWLPLAIDIQGLSEVENDKRGSYLKEVLEELDKKENGKTYAEKLIDGWNEVKKILLPNDGKQVLEERYQIKGDEIEKVKFPVEKEKDKNGNIKKLESTTLRSFIEDNYKNNSDPNFLPNWLQEVVRVIDDKLKK